MKGLIKFNEDETSKCYDLINQINDCLGFPSGETITWQESPIAYCTLDSESGSTIFWGSVIKIDTDQLSECLTPQQMDSIIQLPSDVYICGSNQTEII
jgi:hypothetical protein